MPETYAPVLLKEKAQHLRRSTGDQRYWHPHEKEKIEISTVVTKNLARPLKWVKTTILIHSTRTNRWRQNVFHRTNGGMPCTVRVIHLQSDLPGT